jgi:ATP-binding cassette subfamily B multidrug efflux pump
MRYRLRVTLRLLAYLRPYRAQSVVAYAGMIVVTVLNLALPAVLGWVVDVAMVPAGGRAGHTLSVPSWFPDSVRVAALGSASSSTLLLAAAVLLVGIGILRAVLAFLQVYMSAWLGEQTAYDIRNQYFGHVQHLSFSFHDRAQTGDLMSRAITDIQKVRQLLGDGLVEAVNIPVLFGLIAAAMIRLDARLALVGLAPLVVLSVVTLRYGHMIEPRFKAVQDQEGVISARAQENFTGMRVVKAFAREPWEIDRFAEANEEFYRRRISVIAGMADYFPAMAAVSSVAMVLVLWLGGRMVMAGTLSLGTLVSFNLYVVMAASPAQNLGNLVNRVGEAVASGRRLFEILDTASDIKDCPGAPVLPPLQGRVTFEHVSFGYGGREVLHDVTFEAAPNTVVAVFGPTGSGKSTVVSLIPRFYDVTSGAVLVDGHDVRNVRLDSLRNQVSTVLQDTFLFSATIRDNIAFGRPDASDEEVERAALTARAHGFILELPEGYQTLIGERGVTLSGGQRQRIAIARALLTDPRVLILDDATSAVDTETEHQIQAALSELERGRTTFVIAQRLVTLKQADQIVVLDEGRIRERGTHEELLAAGGLYRRIYDLQLRDQETLALADGASE